MKLFKILTLSLLISSFTALAAAHADTHIVSGSASSSLLFSKSSAWSNDYEASFSIGTGYDYALTNGFQVGGLAGLQIFSGGTYMTLAVGPGFNFSSDIANSFFTALYFGYTRLHVNNSVSDDGTFLLLKAGKRFKLFENVSYVPGLSISKTLGANEPDPSFSLDIFNFSILF